MQSAPDRHEHVPTLPPIKAGQTVSPYLSLATNRGRSLNSCGERDRVADLSPVTTHSRLGRNGAQVRSKETMMIVVHRSKADHTLNYEVLPERLSREGPAEACTRVP